MASVTPRVFLALRTGHPELLTLLARLRLPIVCLTREASEFLNQSSPAVPHLLQKPESGLEITPNDVLVANLTLNKIDVLLHSLVRSCCERRCFVLTRSEDYASFALDGGDDLKQRLIARAFEYCGGFDNSLSRKVHDLWNGPNNINTQATTTKSVFVFDEGEKAEWIVALKSSLTGDASAEESSLKIKVGSSTDSQVGPSAEAISLAKRVAPDSDVEDEHWSMGFLFFSDGISVYPSDDSSTVVPQPCVSYTTPRGVELDADTKTKLAFTAACASAHRIVSSCAFSGHPFVGPLVLLTSGRGRVVDLLTSQQDDLLSKVFASVSNLDELIQACATNSLGFASRPVFSGPTLTLTRKVRLAALGSTPGGTSLQPILDELKKTDSKLAQTCELVLVLSDKENAGVLRRGKEAGVAAVHFSAKGKSRVEFDERVSDELERRGVDLIVLVGYMRIVSNEFCAKWKGRILNVHPSLLPEFAGGMDLQVHTAVLEAKKTVSGCTVHLVTEVVDGGPIVLQKPCPVYPGQDTPEDLKKRVQALEGPCLIESIVHFATKSGHFSDKLTYEMAGVSTQRGDELVERIKNMCKSTRRPGCDPDLGGFGACFDLHSLGYQDPILVSGTDGVGTKLILAQEFKDEKTVGIDLVAMSVNDLIVQGAEPMFFLDYFACGKLSLDQGARVISGIARGCELSQCALIGGETAEMPGMYPEGVYDLAGFAFGVVERSKMLPRKVNEGDVLIGLSSSGIHSNGYSLVRKILKDVDLNAPPPFPSTRSTLKEIVMEPTKVYWKSLKKLLTKDLVEALSHITGSGLPGNLPRVYDESKLYAEVDLASWNPPAIFHFLARKGPVELKEMLSTFNCGVGMVLIVKKENVEHVLDLIPEEDNAFVMGSMKSKASAEEPSVVLVGQSPLSDVATPDNALTYSQAGVDIHKGDEFVERIKPFCKETRRPGCKTLDLGGFGSLFDIKEMTRKLEQPVIVSGTDGVGTKLLLAQEHGKHDTVGIDLVAMSVNDLIVQGAEPLFFLDYLACGKLNVDVLSSVVKGITRGCLQSECALVGGETAEMPGMYSPEEYDLAGFAVGIVDKKDLLPQPSMVGNVLIGLKSSGIHSNGYSLVRKVLQKAKTDLNAECPFELGRTFGDVLLEPTKIYWKAVKPLLDARLIHAMAHITGSGIEGNLPRVYDEKTLYAEVDLAKWSPTKVFCWLQTHGNIDTREMLATFNCGLGMILICAKENAEQVLKLVGEESVGIIGEMKSKANPNDPSVVFVNENVFFQ